MSAKIWRALEEMPTGIGVAADWQHYAGGLWPALQRGFLDRRDEPAPAYACPQECGCAHRVVHHDDGRIVAVCECDPWNCYDIELTAADVVEWEFNRGRFSRALCRAFELERREQELGLPLTQQIASFSAASVPVIVTVQQCRDEFNDVVARLAAKWREGFILFTPTSRLVDCQTHELLSHARAKFFDLETHVQLQHDGSLRAVRRAGELFAPFVTKRDDGASESELQRVFVVLQKLKSTRAGMKAAPYDVFMLSAAEGLSQRDVAKRCGCSLGLVSTRVQFLEREFGRTMEELKAMASTLVDMQTTVKGDGRRSRKDGAARYDEDEPERGEWGELDGEEDETK